MAYGALGSSGFVVTAAEEKKEADYVNIFVSRNERGGERKDCFSLRPLPSAKDEVSGTEPVSSTVRSPSAMSAKPNDREKYSSRTIIISPKHPQFSPTHPRKKKEIRT